MDAGGDDGEDRLGNVGVETGEVVAHVAVPADPQNPLDFGRLARTVADGGDQVGRCGVELGARLAGDFAMPGN